MCRNPVGKMKFRKQNSAKDMDFVCTDEERATSKYNGLGKVRLTLSLTPVRWCRLPGSPPAHIRPGLEDGETPCIF